MVSSARIELVSSSTRVTSVKSTKHQSLSQFERLGPIDQTPGIPGSDKNRRFGPEKTKIKKMSNRIFNQKFYSANSFGNMCLVIITMKFF